MSISLYAGKQSVNIKFLLGVMYGAPFSMLCASLICPLALKNLEGAEQDVEGDEAGSKEGKEEREMKSM